DRVQWYHGKVSRENAENLLKEGRSISANTDGLFLIREGSKNYSLSLLVKCEIKHYILEEKKECYFQIDNGEAVHGLDCFVEYHSQNAHGLPTRLTSFCKGSSPPLKARRSGFTNLLHRSVLEGNPNIVKEILSHPDSPNIDAKNTRGATALHDAAENGYHDIVHMLIKHGCDVSIKDVNGHTALQRAALKDHPNVIAILFSEGKADPLAKSPVNGWIAIHEAAMAGNINSLKILLDISHLPFPRTLDLETPYDIALKYHRNECVKYLENYKLSDSAKKAKLWNHSELNREGCTKLLEYFGLSEGLFLIRNSRKGDGSNVLSLCHDMMVMNYVIKTKTYMNKLVYYIDDGPYMLSIPHLIYHYNRTTDGLPCLLLTAVTTTDSKPHKADSKPHKADSTSHNADKITPENRIVHRNVNQSTTSVTSPTPPTTPTPSPSTSVLSQKIQPENIKEKNIKLGTVLGEGEYGSVLKGVLTYQEKYGPIPISKKKDVAVKLFHEDSVGDETDFLREAYVMQSLKHKCIVELIGVCHGQQLMLIEEFVPMGSMLDYLQDYPELVEVKPDLYLWAGQIAQGMEYLESKKLVHRDLAARNILLSTKYQIKISDFGLSRATGGDSDYYRAHKGGRWPIKWYAPESVNYGKFTHASDVWSYGITLWEMFSYGESPYEDKKGIEVVQSIEKGRRLSRPVKCPEDVYLIMKNCWKKDPSTRPSFHELYNKFD
ncbi:hypothetical protein LOTGIDRAFT_71440, partial [Lottia gigantea]